MKFCAKCNRNSESDKLEYRHRESVRDRRNASDSGAADLNAEVLDMGNRMTPERHNGNIYTALFRATVLGRIMFRYFALQTDTF